MHTTICLTFSISVSFLSSPSLSSFVCLSPSFSASLSASFPPPLSPSSYLPLFTTAYPLLPHPAAADVSCPTRRSEDVGVISPRCNRRLSSPPMPYPISEPPIP